MWIGQCFALPVRSATHSLITVWWEFGRPRPDTGQTLALVRSADHSRRLLLCYSGTVTKSAIRLRLFIRNRFDNSNWNEKQNNNNVPVWTLELTLPESSWIISFNAFFGTDQTEAKRASSRHTPFHYPCVYACSNSTDRREVSFKNVWSSQFVNKWVHVHFYCNE